MEGRGRKEKAKEEKVENEEENVEGKVGGMSRGKKWKGREVEKKE